MEENRDLAGWTSRRRPQRTIFTGRYVRLEPLCAARHGSGLFAAAILDDGPARFRYLAESAPANRAEFDIWLEKAEGSADPLYFAVIDIASDTVGGRQTLMRIDERNGVAEIGHIFWSAVIARRPAATEAFYLFARYVFDELGYRRFEWKCDNENDPSKRAAARLGMTQEGVFRQAAVVKGKNRDTAWFSIIDAEWPAIRRGMENWLHPTNFDSRGMQKHRLRHFLR